MGDLTFREKKILIDVSWLTYVGLYSQSFIQAHGLMTGGVYHVLSKIFQFKKEYPEHQIILCFDGEKGKEYRLSINPEYKNGRKFCPETRTAFKQNLEFIKLLATQIEGVVCLEHELLEADDLINNINALQNGESIIYSTDKDLHQTCHVKTTYMNNIKITTYDEVISLYHDIAPEKIVIFRALKGDASDNLPGYFRMTTKAAIEIVNMYPEIELTGVKTIDKWVTTVLEQPNILANNLAVMRYIPATVKMFGESVIEKSNVEECKTVATRLMLKKYLQEVGL